MLFHMKDHKAAVLENDLNKLQKDGPAAWADLPEDELFTPAGFSSQQAEATEELTFAQQAYEMDSLRLALDGTPANPGLVKIADRYSSTEAGNVAKYLAGAAYYRLGQYEQAISYLEKYVGKDEVTPAEALGMIGDCYAQLDRPEEALKYYEKAAAKRDNSFTAPFYLMKAGNTAIYLKKYSVAEKHFRAIKDNYPESAQAASVDKYIEFAAGAAKNFK